MQSNDLLQQMWLLLLRQDVKYSHVSLKWLSYRNRTSREPVVAPGGPIVSLTTHGKRIRTVYLTLESIANGTFLPSRIILWLDNAEAFKNCPLSLRKLQDRGLEIKLTDNYGPHTKYYPFLESTDTFTCPLVTADDDIIYPKTWLSGLINNFNTDSTSVNCYRAHAMRIVDNKIAPYLKWSPCRSVSPSFLHFATGCHGCIYPPSFLVRLQAAGTEFKRLCPRADDVWLHVNAIRAGFKIKQIVQTSPKFPLLPGTQEECLYLSNADLGENDVQIKNTYKPSDIALLHQAQYHQTTEPAFL
jgi:hypothetical protein